MRTKKSLAGLSFSVLLCALACGSSGSNGGSGGSSSMSPITAGGASGQSAGPAGMHAVGTSGTPALKPLTTGGTTALASTGGTLAASGAPAVGSSGAGGSVAASGSGAGGSAGTVASTGKIPAHGPDPADSLSGMSMGPYKVMMYTTGYPQATEYADSTIYAPTDGEPPMASVAVVPGFVSPQSSIQNWGPFLASYGIATITIGTNSTTDPPDAREVALMGALKTMQGENTRMGSPLMGKLATDVQATMGWSMGGGGTLLAANDHHELKATVSMCAWNPGFSYSMIQCPALMFASQGDPLAGGQSQGFYTSVPDTTTKMLIEIPGGDHFAANDPANSGGMIGRYGLSWLKVFLEGDERYRKILKMMPAVMTTDFQTNIK